MSEELQNEFFSKKTIAGLNKLMLQQSNYQNLNRDGKEKLINILIKNMKVVYRSLDSTKINKDNFTSIFDQFKKHSVNESLEEIKKSNVLMNLQQSSSDLKFERDFKSNPNPGNKFLDRPESTKSITPQVNITKKPNENLSGVSANKSKFDSSLDQAFKPMVENLTDQNFFNNYDTGRNTKDINAMMDNIQQMRQTELNIKNQKPPTPEFLKSKKTNPDKMELRNDVQSMSQSNGKLDFQNMKSSDFNRGFQGLAIDSGDNLMSLDNIDKPLIDQEMTEDTHSFEDRLTRLQSDRENLKVPQTNDKIDFTSENFPQSNMNSNNVIQEQNRVRFNDSNVQTPVKRNDFDIEAKRNEMIREAELKKRRDIELRKEAEMRAQYKQQTPIETNDRFNDLKNSMKMVNIEVKEDVVKINQLKQHIEDLKNEFDELKQENIRLQQNNDYEKIIEIKKQIAKEFEVLSQKNSDLDTKTAEINLKDIEINKKDSELKQLIKNYDYLFRTNQLQIEVINPNNESKYTFPLDKVNDAISIKLMSYSIPYPLFNIEENKNNELKLLYKNDEIILTIPNGKYNIEDLIEILNMELTNKNLNEIEIKINKQQKIIIEITNDEEELSVIPTLLSTENLGFTSSLENKKIHIADKIWDLRMIDKVYLFLNNLSDEVPFGILHFNGKSVCQFKFEKPFDIDKLEIEFKDSKGLPINFYNLSHNLSFMIEKIS